MARDERIDAYIDRQADFARPILEHLRALVREACPTCEETLKWSAPSFLYRGEILAGMAAFKAHATFGFWRARLVTGTNEPGAERESGMGQFGRLTVISDLPPRAELIAMVHKAMQLTEQGVKAPRDKHSKKPAAQMPEDFAKALASDPAASAAFESFPSSARREYVDWIVEAKREETRRRRLEQPRREGVSRVADGHRH